MLAVLQAFAVIAAVIAIGMIVGRSGALGNNARVVLNRAAFHVGVPALLLLTLADADPGQVFSATLLVSAITALTMFGLYFLIASVVLRRKRGEATVGSMAASVVNAGNLGLPLSAYVFGDTTDVSSIILFQSVVLVPLSVAMLDSAIGERGSPGRRILRLLTNPIIAACVIGLVLAFAGVDLPQVVHDPLEMLANLAIPTVLLAFGIGLSERNLRSSRDDRADLFVVLLLKNLLMPLVAYALARWGFGASPEELMLITVLAALPAAQNINTYAGVYQRGEALARSATLISTALSVPVITIIVALTG